MDSTYQASHPVLSSLAKFSGHCEVLPHPHPGTNLQLIPWEKMNYIETSHFPFLKQRHLVKEAVVRVKLLTLFFYPSTLYSDHLSLDWVSEFYI